MPTGTGLTPTGPQRDTVKSHVGSVINQTDGSIGKQSFGHNSGSFGISGRNLSIHIPEDNRLDKNKDFKTPVYD